MIVPRLQLDDCLQRAAERSGARVLQGVRVARLSERDGVVCGAEGPELRWRARIVIAADGYGSVGLPALERPAPRGRYLGVSATLYARGVRFPLGPDVAEHLLERDLPYGYAWVFPEVEGVANLGVYQRQDIYRRDGRPLSAMLEAFVARYPQRFGGMVRVGKVRSWSLPLAPAPWRASGPGLLLAGDAGGFIDPLTGEGIWQALFSGICAGRVAAEAVQGPGELRPELCRRFERDCARYIGRPSMGKVLAQGAIHWLISSGMYRLPPVQLGLGLAYGSRFFGVTRTTKVGG
jgi:flavin-dependent dehydrogenase